MCTPSLDFILFHTYKHLDKLFSLIKRDNLCQKAIFAIPMFDKLKLDDPVGALSIHLVNGIWGTLAVGIFVDNVSFMTQLKGVIVVGVFAFTSSYYCYLCD